MKRVFISMVCPLPISLPAFRLYMTPRRQLDRLVFSQPDIPLLSEALIRELLKIDPPIISFAFSGYSAERIVAYYGDFGFKGLLQMPIKIEEVSALLDTIRHP